MPVDANAVACHYDELDYFYRKFWGDHLHHGLWLSGKESAYEAVENLVNLLADWTSILPGTKVCDIGCGYGATARLLANQYKAFVTGLTLSQKQFLYAKERASLFETYIHCNWLQNTLPSESFDVAFAIESSEHMESQQVFLQEAHRVLVPGGRLAICSWLRKEGAGQWAQNCLLGPIEEEGRLKLRTSKELIFQLRDAGFKNIQFYNYTEQVKKTWSICSVRVIKALFTDRQFFSYLMNSKSMNRHFLKTVFRIKLAYLTAAMQYGIFIARK